MSCTWTLDAAGDHYSTTCGHAWEFTVDGIKENGVKFCPFCGQSIEEAHD